MTWSRLATCRAAAFRDAVHRVTAVTMMAVLVLTPLASCRRKASDPSPGSQAVSPPGTAQATSPQGAAQAPEVDLDVSSLLASVTRIVDRIDGAEWDVNLKAASLDGDIDAAFAYVRDHIGFDAYAGVLRGASGTYASRAGNSPDRALLLAALLNQKGIRTRFVLGRLDTAHSDALLRQLFRRVDNARQFPTARDSSERFYDRVLHRADRDYRILRTALSDHLLSAQSPSAADLTREMNPHVWVQAESQGTWIHLDPSFPDSKAGQIFATPEREVSELPADLHQRVTIRIVAEYLGGGALRNRTLLETQRHAVDVIDAQIGLTHTKPAPLGGLGGAIAGAFGGRVGDEWTPLLLIQGKLLSGERLDVNDSSWVAEWLEFELEWPGGRREVTRRAIADRAGAAWRRTVPLDGTTLRPLARDDSGPFDMRAIHNVWLSAGRHNLADLADGLQQLALAGTDEILRDAEKSGSSQPADQDPGQALWPFALQNFTWMLWTDHIALPMVNDSANIRLYPDSPRIAIFSQRPDVGDSISLMTDLRRDALRGVSTDRTLATAVGEKKLRFCALQGALEHEALTLTAAAAGTPPSTVQTTSGSASTDAVVFEPGEPAPGLKDRFDRESAARIAEALTAGHIVVASGPKPGSMPGWWQISAAGDGAAVGYQGLNAGYAPKIVPKNPLYVRPTPQQNPYGDQKIYDVRSKGEKFAEEYEKRRAAQMAKAEADAAKYRSRMGQPESQPKGGGNEYGVLVTAVTVLGGLAMKIIGIWTYIMIYAGIEEFIFQLQHPQ